MCVHDVVKTKYSEIKPKVQTTENVFVNNDNDDDDDDDDVDDEYNNNIII